MAEKQEPKSIAELVKDSLLSKINNRIVYAIKHGSEYLDIYKILSGYFSKAYDEMPADVKDLVDNHLNHEWLTVAYVTATVTNHKKARILKVKDEYHHGDLIGEIVSIPDEYKKQIYPKQLIEARIYRVTEDKDLEINTAITFIDNCRPRKICCDAMKFQFHLCDQDGLSCEKYFIKHTLSGQYVIHANNGTYSATFCPFCGTKLYKRDNAHNHRILIIPGEPQFAQGDED